MRFELSIALRYLKARRKQAFLSVVSFIAVLGFILGVMALIVALALMTGFQEDIQEKILGASAHVMVYSAGSRGISDYHNIMRVVASDPAVLSVSPVVYGKVMIYSAGGANGIIIKGIDPGQEGKVTELAAKIDPKVLAELKNPGDERDG